MKENHYFFNINYSQNLNTSNNYVGVFKTEKSGEEAFTDFLLTKYSEISKGNTAYIIIAFNKI